MRSVIFNILFLGAALCFGGCEFDWDADGGLYDGSFDDERDAGGSGRDSGSGEDWTASEARKAFDYLNKVRANPAAYSDECGVDLSYVSPQPALRWNKALAKAAQAKAEDMAARNYYDHTDPDGYGMNIKIVEAGYWLRADWCDEPDESYFESIIAARDDGIEGIQDMIEDKGVNPPGHRIHLLAIDEFRVDALDAGIGFALGNANSDYSSYMCVLIAKHDF